jgi:hypothetical protein
MGPAESALRLLAGDISQSAARQALVAQLCCNSCASALFVAPLNPEM